MEIWGWLIAYVVGFGLLQLLLYRYFQSDEPSVDATPGRSDQRSRFASEGHPERSEADAAAEGAADGSTLHCPYCGATNEGDPVFTFCRECVNPLE